MKKGKQQCLKIEDNYLSKCVLSLPHLLYSSDILKMPGSWNLHNFLLVTLTGPQWSVPFYVRQLHETPHTICPTSLSLLLFAGDEGSGRPVPSPCPPQLPPCPPLSHASVLAGRSRGPSSLRLPPVLLGSAHQAPRHPQDGANSVRRHTRDKHIRGSRWCAICYFLWILMRSCLSFPRITEAVLRHCSAPPPQTYQQWRQSVIGWRRWGWKDIRMSLTGHIWTI